MDEIKKVWQSIKNIWLVDKLYLIVIFYFIFAYSWTFRVALRAIMDDSAFRWAYVINTVAWGEERQVHIYGSGADGYFFIILLLAGLFCSILYLLIRRPDAFTKTVVTFWIICFSFWQIIISLGLGADYTLEGDTFGVVLPYYILGPLEQLVLLLLTIVWIIRDKTQGLFLPELSNQQKKEILYILLTLPITFFLLRFGKQNGTSDQIGLILLYIQFFSLVFALFSHKIEGKQSIG